MIVLAFIFSKRGLAAAAGALLGLCSGSCSQIVVLGSECPEAGAPCVARSDESDASDETDAGDEPLDAEVPRDASAHMDAGLDADVPTSPDTGSQEDEDAAPSDPGLGVAALPFVSLGLLNRDFQRHPGVAAGDVVLSNVASMIPIVGVVISDLPNWYACWVGSVNSVTWELDQEAGTPLYKGDYLSLVLNNVFSTKIEPARQKLPMPMQAGTRYALEMDVLGTPDNGSQLYMEIRGHTADCGGDGTMLARADIRPERSWTTLCMEFTPQQAFSHFLIGPGYTGPRPSTDARVRLDTLRQVSACPGSP